MSAWADSVTGLPERAWRWAESLAEPSLRLGVTGLSGAGKTVFITSLVANLLRRGRMTGLRAEVEGRIVAAMLAPQPDLAAPRFDYEAHLADLYAETPRWPESTRALAQLRISIRYQPASGLGGLLGERVMHLDIVDYPGEWLLDLAILGRDYAAWSAQALSAAETRPAARGFIDWLGGVDGEAAFDEATAQVGARVYASYLRAARAEGFSALTPGRFLLPGDLDGAPALTFAPLPPGAAPRGSLRAEMRRRYDGYRDKVATPFFRDHFARLDRQVILIDALAALSGGPDTLRDLQGALVDVLGAFRPGARSTLARLLGRVVGGRRIDRVLAVVTKADHIHHTAAPALGRFARDLISQSLDQAAVRGAGVETMAIAALRATVEDEIRREGETLPAIRGRLATTGEDVRLHPGAPPETVSQALRGGWADAGFAAQRFAPPRLEPRAGEGPPHLRLDRAMEFLIGDWLA